MICWGLPAARGILALSRYVRALLASVAVVASTALAGCNLEVLSSSDPNRALKPLSEKMISLIEQKDMDKDSPLLVRLFKQESEFEVWKQNRSGQFELLKTYPICRWSGELGPKVKEGDRQAPEGFYTITPGQMNPTSHYYLAFNMGFPNAFDHALGRTGAELMVHGDCSSRGCYAMTDEQIAEIYALAREAFFGGQRAFQVQAYPFRMTPLNLAKHRNNPNMPFWKMLKQGYDHFEVTHHEPKVDVCERRYVFDANPVRGPASFSPAGTCPAYKVPEEIVAAVKDKQHKDEFQTAELIRQGASAAPVRTGVDGGMNPVFAAALQVDGSIRALAPGLTPGTIPPHATAPGPVEVDATGSVVRSAKPASSMAANRAAATTTEAGDAGGDKNEGLFSRMTSTVSQWVGLRSAEPAPAEPPKAKEPKATASSRPKPKPAAESAKSVASATPAAPTKQPQPAEGPQPPPNANLAAAPPTASSGTFEGRWSALR
jgi:murein L,D-transpeptidase YafK